MRSWRSTSGTSLLAPRTSCLGRVRHDARCPFLLPFRPGHYAHLPEGVAIGGSFGNGDMTVGIPLTTVIAIHDISERLAVPLALRVTGITDLRAALIAVGSGLMEPSGAVVGLGISTSFALGYPVALGLAAEAMIFIAPMKSYLRHIVIATKRPRRWA